MKTPVRSSLGRLHYTGRITRESFAEWADGPEGQAAIERVAARKGFSFFGKMYAARRDVWRQLVDAAREEKVVAALQREAEAYAERIDPIVFADGLPGVSVELRRLIVVPRLLVNGEAYRRIQLTLHVQPAVGGLQGGDSLRRWFVRTLIDSLAAAVTAEHPSMRNPFPIGDGWTVVGVDEQFEWQVPFDGPAWHGHYFVLELTRRPITRALRKAASEAIEQLDAYLPSLSYVERTEVLRRASLSLDQLFGSRHHRRQPA